MPHNVDLITTIASAFGLALLFGFAAVRLKLPALVGYLLAGVAIGPFTPGFVADTALASQLAEIGVMLLMFGVGLHFSLNDLMAVKKVALPGAVVQIVVATAMGAGIAHIWGWPLVSGIVFGLALSVASTVVLLKALEARGVLATANGKIAIGWLVVEDLVMVLVLVLLPPLTDISRAGDTQPFWLTLALTIGQVGAFIALMLVGGRRLFPWLLWHIAHTGSRELFTLAVIALALGIAYGSSALFGVSFALGAFFAGMVLRESALSYRAAEESLPLRDAFAVLFFVSVGMLFDPQVLIERPLQVATVVAIIVFGKSLAAFLLVLALRYPLNTALTVSASLAQIGEFSFILAGLGMSLGVLSREGQSLILAGALISIAINPFLFNAIEPIQRWVRKRSALARSFEHPDDPLAELPMEVSSVSLTGHIVLVGHGRIGSPIAMALREHGHTLVIAEQSREIVEGLRTKGFHAVVGDAADPAVLIQAHIARAGLLVITVPALLATQQMIDTAKALNPKVHIVVQSMHGDEAALLRNEYGVDVLFWETELAKNVAVRVLDIADSLSSQPDKMKASDNPAISV